MGKIINQVKEFINGERVQVKTVQDDCIAFADGRTLPAGFNPFTHGQPFINAARYFGIISIYKVVSLMKFNTT